MNPPRIALIHATPLAMAPIADAFHNTWPEAECMNVLDDRLSADLAASGTLDDALVQRFIALAMYVKQSGAQGILFTCSAFGPAIEAAGAAVALPTYKPNEAMFLEALSASAAVDALRVGLLSTFAPSVAPMQREFEALASQRGVRAVLQTACVEGALQALAAGDAALHDRLLVQQCDTLRACDVVMLGQFSMARAQRVVADHLGKPVLASPDSAVRLLKKTLGATA